MGTKIEYSINLLAPSVDSKKFTTDGGVNVWEHFQNKSLTNNNNKIGDKNLQDSMDRIPDRSNIESIKKTMQMHEDIFKNQVRELHRVYSVQKMMMDELKNEIRQKKLWSNNGITMNHPHLFQQGSFHNNVQERSGSCSASAGETKRKQKGFDLERPLAEEVAIFASADEGEAAAAGDGDEEMEVDLTLSIGGSHVNKNNNNSETDNNNNSNSKNKKKKHYMAPLGFSDSSRNNNYGKIKELMMNSSVSFQSDRDCSDPTTPMSSSSVTYDQERERKGPHWLSQGLKLN